LRGKIAYTIATDFAAEQHAVWVANADGSGARSIVDAAMWPAISPDGAQIAYYKMRADNGIYVAGIDGGNPRRVIGGSDVCCVQWSPEGRRLVYFKGSLRPNGTGTLLIAGLDGVLITEVGPGFAPTWAPDGNRLAYAGCAPNSTQCGIFVFDIRSHTARQITRDNGGSPQWSPLGDKIVYQADDGKSHINLFVVDVDGTDRKQLTSGRGNDGQPDWSRDGSTIFWRSDQNGTAWAIYAMNADGSNPRLLVRSAPPDADLWARESLSWGP
jgi:Tol biopolymer transport system component